MARNKIEHITQDELTKLEDISIQKCKYCGKSIWYENTKYLIRQDGKLSSKDYRGTTYRTHKIMNGVNYPICVCQKCLEKKYPDFKDKNVSKIFNTFNKYVSYAFDIPEEIIHQRNLDSAVTVENLIKRYGEEEGQKRFDIYKEKQAYSNSFEYKQQKYGWTKEQYDEFNKSRAVTYENLIKKHGEDEGKKIWDNYCERQAYTSTNQYLIEEFGEKRAKDIMLLKARDIKGYIAIYGEKEGQRLYDEYIETTKDKKQYSKFSKIFFDELCDKLKENNIELSYWYGNNEHWRWSKSKKLYFFDFFIPEIKLVIELNGDYWHCNPKIYNESYVHELRHMTAKEIWEYDDERYGIIKNELNYNLEIIWENDIRKHRNDVIFSLVEKIKEYVSNNKENNSNK